MNGGTRLSTRVWVRPTMNDLQCKKATKEVEIKESPLDIFELPDEPENVAVIREKIEKKEMEKGTSEPPKKRKKIFLSYD